MSIPYQTLFIALAKNKINYLVAGGFAVNFHQVNRSTIDLDLILHLEKENVLAFDRIMSQLGYKPRLPVSGKDFANEETRKKWMKEKNMLVFSYIHSQNMLEVIDIFAEEPKPFSELDRNKTLVWEPLELKFRSWEFRI